jgi:hypothetical protein
MLNEMPGHVHPDDSLLWFNGVDGRGGGYLTPPVPARHFADLARGVPVDLARVRELQDWVARGEGKARRGLKEGLDPCKLGEAGWGVIFPSSVDSVPLREALAPLLDLRRSQAGKRQARFYREFTGEDGYREGESKVAFLARHGAGPGPADPEKVPYYLLLVGDPEAIPFSFQYQLDVQYAVGRLCFDDLEDYRRYAESVVAAERGGKRRPRACFFAPANPGDRATEAISAHLAQPVAAGVMRDLPGWEVETAFGEEATHGRLGGMVDEAPAFLFTACHGLGFPAGDPWQRERQGSLICQDWPGPDAGRIAREHYFTAEDVGEQARVHGLVAFCFACYGAGTPRWDDFTRKDQGARRELAPSRGRGAGGRRPRGAGLGLFADLARRRTADRRFRKRPAAPAHRTAGGLGDGDLQSAVRRVGLRPGGGAGGSGIRQEARREGARQPLDRYPRHPQLHDRRRSRRSGRRSHSPYGGAT